ncbi:MULTISPECIES: nucleotide disphospho-sugar-binding domain-containing protein [Kitasatospora]|uniref:Glycosyltransferase n=1 Tax=Kitasatospora cathayae TaxID=3004092 RepID=A0ABY7PYI4_9ACTN|nr:glycosyltransferase [Kitasatospora sp. HUAS 3-15]WBP85493.1 glycosyltransferase [Kitasatospora sp. HUAS 3-15]
MPAHGHVNPLLAISADLAARGHEVVFLSGARFAAAAERAGVRFVALPAEADWDDRDLDATFPGRASLPPGPERAAFDVRHVFLDPVPHQYRALLALLADFPADAVIADAFVQGALPLALSRPRAERPALIGVGITPSMLPSVDTAPFGLALPPLPGEEGRARNRALQEEMDRRGEPLRRYAEKVFAEAGVQLPPGPRTLIPVAVADVFLQLTVPGFEYPRSDAPASYRMIGALPGIVGAEQPLPEWWDEVTGERPVVVVTQGTLVNDDLGELVAPTVAALADRDVLVVAATARPDGPRALAELLGGGLPGNVRAAGYVPFDRLLPHTDVLVSNGGYGGVQTALRYGVPLVVAGASEDKPEVAARVQWAGVGLDLRTGRPAPEAVGRAVEQVLGDGRFRERARALGAEFAAYQPFDTIAELVESLGRREG